MLLQEIAGISKKYELLYQKTGGYFNIFEIANIATDEVVICRVLHELLSPRGTHYQGAVFLKLFFEIVLKLEISNAELKTARVHREYSINERRRIDLVIETSKRLIPIEVKIYAYDQQKQCFDYYQTAINSNVFYLTLNGSNPSQESAQGLTRADQGYLEVTCISFAIDIIHWLDQCIKQSNTLKIASIREVILQLMSVIRQLTNQLEDDKEMEIKELLMKSPANMRSATAIEKSIVEAKQELIQKLFKSIEEKVGAKKLDNRFDYEADKGKKISDYYRYSKSSLPGISYLYKQEVKDNVDIWVRVEIDWRLYIGYCCPVKNENAGQQLTDKEIKKILKMEPEIDSWWAYWELIPNDDESQCPDFKTLNESYFDLYDESKFEDFTTYCAKRIEELLAR